MPLMCAILSELFIVGDNGWPPQANKQKSVSLKGKVLIIKTFLISQIGYELEINGIPKNI